MKLKELKAGKYFVRVADIVELIFGKIFKKINVKNLVQGLDTKGRFKGIGQLDPETEIIQVKNPKTHKVKGV